MLREAWSNNTSTTRRITTTRMKKKIARTSWSTVVDRATAQFTFDADWRQSARWLLFAWPHLSLTKWITWYMDWSASLSPSSLFCLSPASGDGSTSRRLRRLAIWSKFCFIFYRALTSDPLWNRIRCACAMCIKIFGIVYGRRDKHRKRVKVHQESSFELACLVSFGG